MKLNQGKTIYKLLQANPDLVKLIGNKVYPLIADESTTFPFVVYNRISFTLNGDKDGESNIIDFEFNIVASSYSDSVNVAQEVIKSLIHKNTDEVEDIVLTGASESYIENSFIQTLNFKFYGTET